MALLKNSKVLDNKKFRKLKQDEKYLFILGKN